MDKELSRHTARAKAAGESGVTGGGSLQVQAAEKKAQRVTRRCHVGDQDRRAGGPGQRARHNPGNAGKATKQTPVRACGPSRKLPEHRELWVPHISSAARSLSTPPF